MVPAGEPLLADHLRDDLDTITFGPGGDVELLGLDATAAPRSTARGERSALELPYHQPHNLLNTLAAVAAALAVGRPSRRAASRSSFSAMRGAGGRARRAG